MKKLFNSRFLFIIASSLVVLIALGIGAFYLFDESDDAFVKSGYVLNPLSSKVEKYFFDENATYKENLSSMVEFTDVDDNEVSVLKDSFLHYLDDSLSFLKNGAILDLDSINGEGAVKFYNITNQSIIERNGDGYVIKTASNDIKLDNFIGRISDNKYIVVGSLSAKLAGNATRIEGEYFEIVYVEEGVVNIENKDIKYQVAADGTLIYVGNDLVIDLGDKKITNNDEDVMSITAITIDGDENIEIIPKAPEEDENDEGSGTGSGTGTGDGTGTGSGSGTGDGDGTGSGTGAGGGEGGTGGTGAGNVETEKTDEVIVSLKDASIGSTNVDVTFDVYNQKEDDKFMLKVTNLDSGRTVDLVAEVVADEEIKVNLLSPNTKYLFTVINEKDNGKYFQKIFETTDFGIKLEKTYATDSELAYKISVSEGTDITNAKLTLYKYNEETKQNEVVMTSYYDAEAGETKYVEKVTYISSLDSNIEGVHEVVYDELDSNTIYTAVLDEFSMASSNFKDIYNITLTTMTLKKTPTFSDMTADKDVGSGSFKLSLGNITDEDSAIINYTYLIYENSNPDKTVIDPISKTNASPIEVKIGDDENQLKNDTNYFYKVVIEYFDNEKYIEYITTDSINFVMGSDPYITVVPDEDNISYDKIAATIYLTDNSCLVSMPGREKCTGTSTTVVDVKKINALTGEATSVFTKLVDFTVSENDIKYELYLDNLQAGTTYSIDVRADFNNTKEIESNEILHTEDSKKAITTKSLMNFIADWVDKGSGPTHVVNLQSKFIPETGTGTLSPEESAASIQKVVVKLYEGNNIENLQSQTPIATRSFVNDGTFNIKENFYDNGYVITTDETFGLDIDGLKVLNAEGKLSEYYTIAIYAYYDEYENNQVKLSNNVTAYMINPVLLLENLSKPEIGVEYITKKASGIDYKLNNDGTHVGYTVTAAFNWYELFNNDLIPQSLNWYVYNENGERVSFYVKDEKGNLKLVESALTNIQEDDSGYYVKEIFMDYGTEYYNEDTVMSRGGNYYVGFDIGVLTDNVASKFPANDNKDLAVDYGVYELVSTEKETPRVEMYVLKSDKNSITYRYKVTDPDNAVYRESIDGNYGFYYTIGDTGIEEKIDMILTDEENNIFSGDLTIKGLSNGMLYSLYYKKNVTKTGVLEDDILNYLDGEGSGVRLFDGYYDANDSQYNFKYEVINNPLSDNKVTVKILASDEMLDRILSYKVHFKDEKGNTLDKELWQLSACDDWVEGEANRCFSVEYLELKNAGMKSDKTDDNIITVTIEAIYDNGLTGYDFKVGSGEGNDYKYMIMQNNNTAERLGSYVTINNSGNLVVWGEHLETSRGYYTYSFDSGAIVYTNVLNKKTKRISYGITGSGYTAGEYGILNPKMVSVEAMKCDDNTFAFSSITPMIDVQTKANLINGAVMGLTLTGADLANDFKNEGTADNPKYYLYIKVWGNEDDARNGYNYSMVRPSMKVELKTSEKDGIVTVEPAEAIIDGLFHGGNYYFNVYALMYKGGDDAELTQLFDAKSTTEYVTKAYNFKAWDRGDLFISYDVKPSVNDEVYGYRNLNAKLNLKPYVSPYQYNFDVVYLICEDYSNCNLDDENSYIFRKDIAPEETDSDIIDVEDITKYDLEFGSKTYFIKVYAIYDSYYGVYDTEETKPYTLQINMDASVTLDALKEPTFVVNRSASVVGEGENSDYVIDFDITVSDPDRTLVGRLTDGSLLDEESQKEKGKYYVRLKDVQGNVVGILQEIDEDGNYVDICSSDGCYVDYALDATVLNKKVRIRGLDKDTKYTIEVYSNAYLNNYSEVLSKEERTYEIKKSHTVYSVNDYGVAFGRDLLYSATEKSIVVTFLGGSNFNNVTEVSYTIGLWDNEQSTSTSSGTYILGEDKYFEQDTTTKDWRFVINPEGMSNVLGQTYTVALSFKVKVPGTVDEYIVLTSKDNESFSGRAQYVEDKNKK